MLSPILTLLLLFARPAAPDRLAPVDFASEALAGKRQYVAWLPPGYDPDRAERYPLVLLLHGLGGGGRDWFDPGLGDLQTDLRRLVTSGAIPPFIAVAPDGGNGYWTDHLGAPRERYGAFIDEVLADAGHRFRAAPDRLAIVGASMGGHGALSRALMAPGRFRAVVSIAGALFPEPPTHRPIYKKVWGSPADRAHWLATSPMALLERTPRADVPPIFLACGADERERFLDWNVAADRRLTELGIAHAFVLTPGPHGWTTWRALNQRWLEWLAPHLR